MTNAPTAEFKRHHDVDEPRVDERSFRQGWRVRTRLDQLLAAGRITRSEWQAASEYRATWAIARELVGIEPGMIRVAGSGGFDEAMTARIDATTKLRVVEDRIGADAARLLLAAVVFDIAWAKIARVWHCDPHRVRDLTVLAIRALATAWTGSRRRVAVGGLSNSPPAPRRRVAAS